MSVGFWSRSRGIGGSLAILLVAGIEIGGAAAADRTDSKLLAEAAKAERILMATPEPKGGREGQPIDAPPGSPFLVEINRVIRGTGRKSGRASVINGGDKQQHPKYTAGQQYLFLLKKNPEGKYWLNLSATEIPVRNGKAQYIADGKVVEEVPLSELDELASRDEEPVETKGPTRNTLIGRWFVVQSRQGMDEYLWLIDIAPAENTDEKKDEKQEGEKQDAGTAEANAAPEFKVKLISSWQMIHASALKSASISGNDVRLTFDADGINADFRGRFENGRVRGNMLSPPSLLAPARLEPTDAKNMSKHREPLPDPIRDEFISALQQDEPFGPLLRMVRRHPDSPLTLGAWAELLDLAGKQGFDRARFEELGSGFVKSATVWGPRLEVLGYTSVGLSLSRRDLFPDLALEYLTTAQQHFDDSTPADIREMVLIERGKRLIGADHVDEGVALLRQARGEFPFQPEATHLLARQAEKEGRIDEAIELFGELAMLPQMEAGLAEAMKTAGRKLTPEETPRRVATRLWVQKHGGREGLSEYLDELYESRIRSIATDKRPPRGADEGSRVAVCELFTGSTCHPCIAADVATLALEATYEKSELIVLRYHESVPRPDPLANEETKNRFELYRGDATPTLLLNGRFVQPPYSGTMAQAPETYRRLRAQIEPVLEEKVALRIEMSAAARKGKIAISAKAEGISTFPPNSRLILILTEDRIEWPAPNGIRTHEMVVRAFPAGVTGAAPVSGELSHTSELDLGKLKSRLAKQLAKAEEEGRPFDEKPMELKALHLVGLLQNGETGEVMQGAAVPVTGLE